VSDELRRSDYVRKVQEGNRKYTLDLISENQGLRTVLAQCEGERDRLKERLRVVDPYLTETAALRTLASSLEREKAALQEELALAQHEIKSREEERLRLHRGMARIEEETRRLSEQHAAVEQQNSDLANLYVASFRLLGTLDRDELIAALNEIIANIIGCEESLVLELDAARGVLQVAGSVGIDPAPFQGLPKGKGIIGACASSGDLYVAETGTGPRGVGDETNLSACIPLRFGNEVTGVIALFRLLPQKASGYEPLDREVFDLLGTHAATALYVSSLHAARQRSVA
jgi:hypothetical protein